MLQARHYEDEHLRELLINPTQFHREYVRVMALPNIRERFQREGAEAVGTPPAEFAAFVQSEVVRWTEVARKAGMKPES